MTSKKTITESEFDGIPEFDLANSIPSPFADRYDQGVVVHVFTSETDPAVAGNQPGVATAVRCDRDWVIVDLSNGDEVRARLANFPRLARATSAQRRRAQIEDGGTRIRWPDVDEELRVSDLLIESDDELARWRASPGA